MITFSEVRNYVLETMEAVYASADPPMSAEESEGFHLATEVARNATDMNEVLLANLSVFDGNGLVMKDGRSSFLLPAAREEFLGFMQMFIGSSLLILQPLPEHAEESRRARESMALKIQQSQSVSQAAIVRACRAKPPSGPEQK